MIFVSMLDIYIKIVKKESLNINIKSSQHYLNTEYVLPFNLFRQKIC
jgi:hypothetical protein